MKKSGRKNPAGGWLMERVLLRFVLSTMGVFGLSGLVLGIMVRDVPVVDRFVGQLPYWATPVAAGVIFISAIVVWSLFMVRTDSTWHRGLAAERRVGDRIEHALVGNGCAFAHDVKEAIGSGGNVDHIVLTPAGVWVVETKAAWLGGRLFKEALQQVSRNVRQVRKKLATPLPIRGALVIADDGKPFESDCDWFGEPIKAFRLVSFWKQLREECDGDAVAPPPELEALARKVWGLGSTSHLTA